MSLSETMWGSSQNNLNYFTKRRMKLKLILLKYKLTVYAIVNEKTNNTVNSLLKLLTREVLE